MKTYQKQSIANQIAAKFTKSKGMEHLAFEVSPGQWAVMTEAQFDAHQSAETKEPEIAQVELSGTEVSDALLASVPDFTNQEDANLALALSDLDKGDQTNAPEMQPTLQAAPKKDEPITITLPEGSYERGGYVYTPKIDGKQRWFATKSLIGIEMKDKALSITITRKALKSRGLTEDMLQAA